MRALFSILLSLFSSLALWGQVSATATIPMSVRVPGSISLSMHSTPVSIAVTQGTQRQFEIPLSVEWNLDPRETTGFRVVAYFNSPGAALTDFESGISVAATSIVARWGEGSFLPFQHNDSRVSIFSTSVLGDLRRAKQSQTLQVKIADETLAFLPDGDYQGTLYLEVQNY